MPRKSAQITQRSPVAAREQSSARLLSREADGRCVAPEVLYYTLLKSKPVYC